MRHQSRRTSLTFHFLAPGETQRYYLSSQQGFVCGFISTCRTTQRHTVLGKNRAPQSLNRTPPCPPPEWFTHKTIFIVCTSIHWYILWKQRTTNCGCDCHFIHIIHIFKILLLDRIPSETSDFDYVLCHNKNFMCGLPHSQCKEWIYCLFYTFRVAFLFCNLLTVKNLTIANDTIFQLEKVFIRFCCDVCNFTKWL